MSKKKSKVIVKPVCLDEETIKILTTLGEGNLSKGVRDAASIVKGLKNIQLLNNGKAKTQ